LGTVTAIAGSLAACSSISQSAPSTSASGTAATNIETAQAPDGMMHHQGMNHGMDLGPADANYDLRFIDAMIPHHEGAVVMAEEALQKSKRPEIRQLAEAIIQAQNKEIDQMNQWRSAWYPKAPATPMAWYAEMGHMMAMSPNQRKSMMMQMDLGPADAEFDLRFLDAMIPHHEGAVVMANDLLKKSDRPEMKQLAQTILTSQQAEIEQMRAWRKAWYG
jgi:uncharacterized protein (DUF305 family)